jgi:hypothetical protein
VEAVSARLGTWLETTALIAPRLSVIFPEPLAGGFLYANLAGVDTVRRGSGKANLALALLA